MSAVIALSIAACGAEKDTKSLGGDSSTWGPGDSSKVEIPDPFVDCETLDEAKEKAGFDMIIPDAIDGYDSRKIYAIEKELISVVFVNDKDGQICFRKGVGEADVSGDFTEYAETEQVNMGGTTITLKGSDGKANLAVWAKDGYAYSISSTEEVNKVTMTDLVTTVNDDMAIGGDPSTWGPGNQADVEIPNPFTDCYTLKEAEELAGFSLKAPARSASWYPAICWRSYILMGKKLLPVSARPPEPRTSAVISTNTRRSIRSPLAGLKSRCAAAMIWSVLQPGLLTVILIRCRAICLPS